MPATSRLQTHRAARAARRQDWRLASYYAAIAAWETAREAATSLYATEVAEWTADNPRPTWKQWLIDSKAA